MPAEPLLTVFTSTVFADVARIWFQCVSRAFSDGLTRFEIFHDSDGPQLDPQDFPGATILHRTSTCREFHDAYNEAVQRCQTQYLAIIDTDVFWVSHGVWPRVQQELKDPKVAAVSCVSRSRKKSHGTYSVVLKPEIYREVMKTLPDGFFPRAKNPDPNLPVFDWQWYDTGDVLSLAVVEAGYKINFYHMDRSGEIVRFFGVTLTRRGAATVGERKLAEMAGKGRYFWRGWSSNLTLRRLHNHLFPNSQPYGFSLAASSLLKRSIWASPKRQRYRLCFLWLLWRSAGKVKRFVRN